MKQSPDDKRIYQEICQKTPEMLDEILGNVVKLYIRKFKHVISTKA